jgi:hypothetical protein
MVLPFPLSPPYEGGSKSFYFVTSPSSPPSKGGDNLLFQFRICRKKVIITFKQTETLKYHYDFNVKIIKGDRGGFAIVLEFIFLKILHITYMYY